MTIFEHMLEGFAYCRMLYDKEGRPEDFIYLSVNAAFNRIIGTTTVTDKRVTEVFPGIREAFPELFEIYGRVALTGKPEAFDLDFKPIGKWLHISVYSPSKEHFVTVFEDITDRKQAEDALRESEKRYRSLFDGVSMGRYRTTPSGQILDINPALVRLLGYPDRESLLAVSVFDLYMDPGDRNRCLALIEREGIVFDFEVQFRKYDGTIIWVRDTGEAVHDDSGQVIYYNGNVEDITNRKQVEQVLQLHSQIVQNMAEGVIMIRTSDGMIVYANPRFEHIFGYDPDELIGRHISRIIAPGSRSPQAIANEIISSLEQTGIWSGEVHNIRKDGTTFWCHANVSTFQHHIHGKVWIAVHEDITERKRAEAALRQSEEHYRTLAEATHDAIYLMTPDGVMKYVNNAGAAMMGLSPEKIVGLSLESLFSPSIAKEFRKNLDIVVSSKKHVRTDSKFRLVNQNQISWIDTHFVPQFDSDGSVVQVLGISRNITDRKQAELLLKCFNEELESQVRSRMIEFERINTLLEDEVIQRTQAEESVRKSLNERELLLREIHHRVKNNLQIILSLISLQSRNIKDPHLRDTMGDFQNRIMAMAHVHERMCRADDISRIDLSEIVTFLGTNLFKSYNVNPQHIQLNVEMKDLQITIDSAIPISLIINELITNSIKHAFPNGTPGEITIAGRREADTLVLSFKDTGIGIPKDLDWMRNKKSLGLRLVVSLVEQLSGTIELDRTTGTAFNIVVHEK